MTRQIPWAQPTFWGNEQEYVRQALASTWISAGPFVERLEAEFSAAHGSAFGLSCANGTAALFLALRALNVGPGDEVIVPAFTFIAPINMVLALGATPIFADVDAQTWLMDPNSVRTQVTKATKVILPVHSYGNVCAMDELRAIATEHELHIVEDVAEAIFSRYKGQLAGSFSTISSFSFQTTKTITCGEGGMVLCNDADLAKRMRSLKSHGAVAGTYQHEGVAYNFRLTNYQAAMVVAQLEHRADIEAGRRQTYDWYRTRFASVEQASMQHFAAEVDPVVWAFGLKLHDHLAIDRSALMRALGENGIECRPGFATCHTMPAYDAPHRPAAQEISDRVLSLPFHLGLSEEDVEFIYQKFTALCH